MVLATRDSAFRRDKQQFFSKHSFGDKLTTQMDAVEERAKTKEYSFVLNNRLELETEFLQMFALLKEQDPENKEKFWLYCYYCACLLEHYHRAYSQFSKEEEYKKVKTQIKKRLLKEQEESDETEEAFINKLYNSYLTGFRNALNTPFHIAQIRDYVAYANLCRIYWVFSRLTFTNGLTLAKAMQIIDKLDAILGTHIDVDNVIATVQAPSGFLSYCSVGFFLIRFMIDSGLLIKHTFFPSELEKGKQGSAELTKMDFLPGAASIQAYRGSYILLDKNDEGELYYIPKQGAPIALNITSKATADLRQHLGAETSIYLNADQVKKVITEPTGHSPEQTTPWERFKQELYKRHCNFANDLVWATINFLSNFNKLCGISDPVAGYLTAVFLLFDVGMALYKCELAKKEYTARKADYLAEIEECNNYECYKGMSAEERLAHVTILHNQLLDLEISWKTKEATFHFAAAAAALLAVGFTAALLVNPGVFVVASFFACTVAVAMYLSTSSYSKYQEKSLRLEHAKLTDHNLSAAQKEFESARTDFLFTLTQNTVAPMLLLTTYAVCWPAGVALTVAYWGSQLYHSYGQHQDENSVKKLSKERPSEDEDLAEQEEHSFRLGCC